MPEDSKLRLESKSVRKNRLKLKLTSTILIGIHEFIEAIVFMVT